MEDDFLTPIKGPELVFGLVGPIGTDLELMYDTLKAELSKVGYESHFVKVTDTLSLIDLDFGLAERPLEKRFESYMNAGNTLRQRLNRNDAFALLSVAAIRNIREEITGEPNTPATKTAYIVSQFKRPEEIEMMRSIYGRGFIQISAYSSSSARLDSLTRKIASSYHHKERPDYYRGRAYDLMTRDEEEQGDNSGQRLRDTFALADVVINADDGNTARQGCERFIRAYFGDAFVTPTCDEYGAFSARAAAYRSSDLARQVGAVIMSQHGEIITVGCNEVPKAGGGTYWEGAQFDYRDFTVGYDSSVKGKQTVLEDAFRRLKEAGWLRKGLESTEIPDLVKEALWSGPNAIMKNSQLMDILEFGRSVHAEMIAITDAARLGRSLRSATLYSTTFPCHICARHIIAAGIDRVVYVEPYSKSLTSDLYPDSVSIDGAPTKPGPKVKFEPFIGIAPPRYTELFSREKGLRKDKMGTAKRWDRTKATPILKWYVATYPKVEAAALGALIQRMDEVGLKLNN